MNKTIAIVILNYKNWQDTVECLESVFACTYQPCRVIVVDNDSQNDSLEHIAAWLDKNGRAFVRLTQEQSEKDAFVEAPLVLIQSAANRGYSAGNNIGIRWAVRAGDPYALILNNDTVVEKDFLQPLADFLETHPDTAMVGPKILDLNGNIDRNCARRRPSLVGFFFRFGLMKFLFPKNRWILGNYYLGEYDYSDPKEVDVLSGSCMLLRTDILKQMGCLDETTFLFLEEAILFEKISSFLKKTYIVPASRIVHKKGASTVKSPSLFILKKELDSFSYYLREYRGVPFWCVYFILYYHYFRYFLHYLKRSS